MKNSQLLNLLLIVGITVSTETQSSILSLSCTQPSSISVPEKDLAPLVSISEDHAELLKRARELEEYNKAQQQEEALEILQAATQPQPPKAHYENLPFKQACLTSLEATKTNITQMIVMGKIPAVILGYFGLQHWFFSNHSIATMCTKAGWFFTLKTASLMYKKEIMNVFSEEMNFNLCFMVAAQALPMLQQQIADRIVATT